MPDSFMYHTRDIYLDSFLGIIILAGFSIISAGIWTALVPGETPLDYFIDGTILVIIGFVSFMLIEKIRK